MEFATHQPLKIYSGGLGFLAGSHLRSAYELRQNLIGVGILWKYGYYDQERNQDQTLDVAWNEKHYSFLEDTGIKFQITIHEHPVWVKALYLNPETFKTAPLFLLSTDLPENDYVSQTITHRLYDANVATKVAQFILLGVGGAKLVDLLGFNPELYHLNEAHGLSAAFYLYKKFSNNIQEVKKRLVFTTHTPEEAGNEKHDIYLCHKLSYFCGLSVEEVKKLYDNDSDQFNHSLAALRFARLANGVSQLHGRVARAMWEKYENICPIISITNAQNWRYWADKQLYRFMEAGDEDDLFFGAGFAAATDRMWQMEVMRAAGRGRLSEFIGPESLPLDRFLRALRRLADLDGWDWARVFDVVAGIFIQFVGPEERSRLFTRIDRALKPGGILLLHGYAPRQVGYGTGGPPFVENMYTLPLLRQAFAGYDVLRAEDFDAEVDEGRGHSGRSALIDFVARKPVADG